MQRDDVQVLTEMWLETHRLVDAAIHITHSTNNVTIRRFAQIVRDQLNVTTDTLHWMLSLAEKED